MIICLSTSPTSQNGGGYQTPTWAYKIDSGFPAPLVHPMGVLSCPGPTRRNDIGTDNPMGKGRSMWFSLIKAVICTTHQIPAIAFRKLSVHRWWVSIRRWWVPDPNRRFYYELHAGNGAQVTSSNDNLSVSITYQSNGGGYQTPTWAYKIDSVSRHMVHPMVVLGLSGQPIETIYPCSVNPMGKGRSMSSSCSQAVIYTTHRSPDPFP